MQNDNGESILATLERSILQRITMTKPASHVVVFQDNGENLVFNRRNGAYILVQAFDESEDAKAVQRYGEQLKAKRKKRYTQPAGAQMFPGMDEKCGE